jgi:hypothetical protein
VQANSYWRKSDIPIQIIPLQGNNRGISEIPYPEDRCNPNAKPKICQYDSYPENSESMIYLILKFK